MKTGPSNAQARWRLHAAPAWLVLRRRGLGMLALVGLLLTLNSGARGDSPALTEYQVKALFLMNFTKYVEWPAAAFEQADSPITIGVLGEDHFGEDLKKAVEGKIVNGRKIMIVSVERESDLGKCHILFVSASEKKRLAEILGKVGSLPILTVGETDQFIQQGGVVNFTRKDGKVRLEVNLEASQKAKVEISSKLLSVADVVRGKS